MNGTRVWLVVSPIAAAGVLVAHSLAYRLTGTPTDPFHAYLEHVPQVLLLIALGGLAFVGFGSRLDGPPARVFPCVALAAFVVQEHLERLVHTGGVPWLLTSPAFLVGLALQIPVALAAWAVARWLLAVVHEDPVRASVQNRFELRLALSAVAQHGSVDVRIPPGRAPPQPLL